MTPKRLVFASPTYGPVDSQVNRTQRAAIMHAQSSGAVSWVGDLSPERMTFSAARNTIVQGVINAAFPVDGIFWCDSDVLLPADGITRLVLADREFITGMLVQRAKPHWPLVANYDSQHDVFRFLKEWPANVIGPVDACGFGCVLTSTAMLLKMTPPWFSWTKFSEDFEFCLGARRAGYRLWMDTGCLCGHLKEPEAAWIEDFTRLRDSGALEADVPAQSAA